METRAWSKEEGGGPGTNLRPSNNTTFAVNMEIASDSPDTSLSHPSYPCELVYSDHLTLRGREFLIIIKRHSAWASVYDMQEEEGTQGLISALKTHFTDVGNSREITSDEGPGYTDSISHQKVTDRMGA